jgi:hypothetical protein
MRERLCDGQGARLSFFLKIRLGVFELIPGVPYGRFEVNFGSVFSADEFLLSSFLRNGGVGEWLKPTVC